MALALPLASLPVAAQELNNNPHELAMTRPAVIPYRQLPVRQRGTTVIPVDPPTDGVSDCGPAIQAAIDALPADGGTVLIRHHGTAHSTDCIYMIDTSVNVEDSGQNPHYGIKLRSNMLLQFEPGVQLQATPNNLPRAYVLYLLNVHDVEIGNGSIIGERYTHTNSGHGTDEWGYGIAIAGSTQVTVRSTHVSSFEGDGISIARAGTPTIVSTDVVIWDVVCSNNRRQAVSITSGDQLYFLDSVFSDTHGTAPSDGIDIEGSVSNVWIDNCIIQNNQGNGVEVNGSSGTYHISNINITNCVLSGNYSGIYVADRATSSVNGGTFYGNAIYQNRSVGIHFGGPTSMNFSIGGTSPCDLKNNSFANNLIADSQMMYPISAKAQKQGYVPGPAMSFSDPALEPAKNNVIGWNFYYSPDASYTGANVHPCIGLPFQQ
jgi:polygalacturonase